MDFNAIHQRLTAIQAPGVLSADTLRAADPEDKADKGRSGEPYILLDPSAALEFEPYAGMCVVTPVHNCSLCDLRLSGAAQQVEKHLGIRRLRCKGRWQQEQE